MRHCIGFCADDYMNGAVAATMESSEYGIATGCDRRAVVVLRDLFEAALQMGDGPTIGPPGATRSEKAIVLRVRVSPKWLQFPCPPSSRQGHLSYPLGVLYLSPCWL